MAEEDLKELTKELFHSLFEQGDSSLWFSHLYKDSVFICRGEPVLFGDLAIKDYYSNLDTPIVKIDGEEYNLIDFGDNGVQVYGSIVTSRNQSVSSTTYFAITYLFVGGQAKIILQHQFYDYETHSDKGQIETLNMDINTIKFVKSLLLDAGGKRIPIKCGDKIINVDLNAVLYVGSSGKKTEIRCVDRIITANASFGKLTAILPENFYPLRRGVMVNTKFIVNMRRCEIELISGITLPVPERNYAKIKRDLMRYVSDN
ncbi:MAG: LytTR family transcriptional regulator DNA-binding domain-containing protein [Candidatus Coproplasma sp.]